MCHTHGGKKPRDYIKHTAPVLLRSFYVFRVSVKDQTEIIVTANFIEY